MNKSGVTVGGVAILIAAGVGAFYWNAPAQQARRYAASLMKDPDSAQFNEVEVCKDVGGSVDYVTGEVNSKNSYGAYSGFEHFMVDFTGGDPFDFTTFDDDDGILSRMLRVSSLRVINNQSPLPCHELDDAAKKEVEASQTTSEALP